MMKVYLLLVMKEDVSSGLNAKLRGDSNDYGVNGN